VSELRAATFDALKTSEPQSGTSQLWKLFVVAWVALAGIGVLLLRIGVPWMFAVLLIAPVTLAGVAWRPLFGVCLMALLVPFGAIFVQQQVFTSEKGMGILFALGAALNLLVTRKHLRVRNPVVLALFGLTALALLSITWSVYAPITVSLSITMVQLFVYVVLLTVVIRNEKDLEWPLRVMVLACVSSYFVATALGVDLGVGRRFAIALSEEKALNPNVQGEVYGLAFLSALYLYRRETIPGLKWVWVAAAVLLPIGVLATGARKASFFLIIPIMLPLLSPRFALRRPGRTAAIILGIGALAGVILYVLVHIIPADVASRYTDTASAKVGYQIRLAYIQQGIEYISRHPLGAGLGAFRSRIGAEIHNDFFYLLVNLGFIGGLVFGAFAVAMLVGVMRMPPGTSRWFAGSVVLYLLLVGLGGTYIFGKHYWMFMAFVSLLVHFQRKGAPADTAGTARDTPSVPLRSLSAPQ